ncbi:uncharacterized protein LOC127875261 [Dreissena polymorpha]|uniref:Uncharacterized protein n=1 Tax=Dreissena polymorpha TaxID=45954 RepID=A0A9D4R3A4_DREPO|nr:uncharacterized protein LOC127875261 [Dreissena polymorpha]KAH3853349.1 hypothetical protein DPMN_095871 [Dreissena polymorpha]
MSEFVSHIQDSGCAKIHRVVTNGDERYLCFTRLANSAWFVIASDGVSVWKTEVDEDEADTIRELAGISTTEAFVNKIRNGFQNGDISVAAMGNKVTLTIGKGCSPINLDLFEAKAADKRTELQTVLFRLAESATLLSADLDKSKQLVETLKAQQGAPKPTAFMDLGPKKGLNPAKTKQKQAGMSVINPTSKKRKAAQGVVFD